LNHKGEKKNHIKGVAKMILIVLQWTWLAHHWRFGASSESKLRV